MADKKYADMVDEYAANREEKAELMAAVKEIDDRQEEIKTELLGHLERSDSKRMTFRNWTVYTTKTVVPTVEAWDKFFDFVVDTNAGHLIQRRPSVPACREHFATKGMMPPGLREFEKVSIGVKKA